ncbi:MAG: flagellar brake protein [Gammaproteobacteria bacterium]|nr:flagellar brake protein [Gammaproteobacteria bacterium]
MTTLHHQPTLSVKSSERCETIQAVGYIALLLQQLAAHRTLLTLNTENQSYITTLLRLESKRLLCDLPYHYSHPRQWHIGDTLTLQAVTKTHQIQFTTTLAAHGCEEGLAFLALHLPHELIYQSDRADHRIMINAIEVTLIVRVKGRHPLFARLRDISARGVQLTMELAQDDALAVGESAVVALMVSEGCEGSFPFRVVRRDVDSTGVVTVAGVVLLEDRRVKRAQQQLVACLQRRILRAQQR